MIRNISNFSCTYLCHFHNFIFFYKWDMGFFCSDIIFKMKFSIYRPKTEFKIIKLELKASVWPKYVDLKELDLLGL